MTSSLSFHVIFDGVYQDLNPLRIAIASLQPRVINIVGGARKSEAFTFAVEMQKKYPAMRVIFRNYPDDGNHAIDKYKLVWHRDAAGNLVVDDYSGCQRWIDDNATYLAAGLTVLTDNESVNDNMDMYAAWQAKIMDLTGAKGWKVAVGRFAVGNPRETDYPRMNAMWQKLAHWHPLHTWSPNEYLPQDMSNAGGMVARYRLGIAAAKNIGAWPFTISIGEYAVVYRKPDGGLDAFAGFHDSRLRWSGTTAFQYLRDSWVKWYKQDEVDASIYCWGGDGTPKWDRFRVDTDNEFITAITSSNTKGELEPMTTQDVIIPVKPVVPTPGNIGAATRITVQGTSGWNLRDLPELDGKQVGTVKPGEQLDIFMSTITPNGGHSWYFVNRVASPATEAAQGYIAYVLPVTQPAPDPVPPVVTPVTTPDPVPPVVTPEPEPLPPDPVETLYTYTVSFSIRSPLISAASLTAIENGLRAILSGIVWLGAGLGSAAEFDVHVNKAA